MRRFLAILASVMVLAGAAWAQDEKQGATGDIFRNGGRPESNAGDVQQPASQHGQQAGDALRLSVMAQQYGNLASMRRTTGPVHELGDRMVATNSRITKALSPAPAQTPPEERAAFDTLARHADEVAFAAKVARWVTQNYPVMISALERGDTARDLPAGTIEDLRSQLDEAKTILQTAQDDPERLRGGEPRTTGTIGSGNAAGQSD